MLMLILSATLYSQDPNNPPQPGFNMDDSDPQAIILADKVMQALGGRQNWDNTRHITWNFFGRRTHVWDKWTGNYRLEADSLLVLMNLNTLEGKAWIHQKPVTDEAQLSQILQRAKSIWINDSYWMFMPYKLKDTGVTLKYVGKKKAKNGVICDVLQLTFEKVGDTPQNKYYVYVDPQTSLVAQWDYFANAVEAIPKMSTPWENWRTYGKIKLADSRGERKMNNIAVFDMLPEKVYQSPEKIDIMQFQIGMPE
jgi:hypothetical protein